MAETIYAAFADPARAESAAGALLDHGVAASDISLVLSEEAKHRTHGYADAATQNSQPTIVSGPAGSGNPFDPLGNEQRRAGIEVEELCHLWRGDGGAKPLQRADRAAATGFEHIVEGDGDQLRIRQEAARHGGGLVGHARFSFNWATARSSRSLPPGASPMMRMTSLTMR